MNTQAVTGTLIAGSVSPSKILRKVAKTSYGFAIETKKHATICANASADWFEWLMQTSIVRSVAPDERPQERHEFESIELRRGGFGNV